jgi:uncharacterized protein YjbI with pentapeptide repeats
VWTLGGVARVSVFVKASFTLVHDGPAQLVAPAELVTSDRMAPPVARGDLAPAQGLAAASEVAPYLPNAGVVLVGSAHAPLGLPTPAMAARLAVYAGDRPLVDKLLHVYGDRTASAPTPRALTSMPLVYERAFGGLGVEDNPVGVGASVSGALPNVVDPKDARRPAGFGPLAPTWGHRRRLLGSAARPSVERGALVVASELDFRYFHAAPADQQTELLAGDEWLLLDGLDAERPRLRSRLPSARGVARCQVVGARDTELRAIELSADTLVIDADRRVCHVVWRGHVPIDSVEGAARLRVFAGVEMPGFTVPWPDAARPARAASVAPPPRAPTAERAESRTTAQMPRVDEPELPRIMDLDDSTETTGRVLVRQPAATLPFTGAAPRDVPSAPGSAPAYGLPFRSASSSPAAAPSPPAAAPAREETPAVASYDFDEDAHTTALSMDELRDKLLEAERAPFKLAQPGANAAPRAEIPGAPWSKQPVAKPPAIDDDMTVGVRVPPPELITRLLAEREARAQQAAAPAAAESPWARGAPPHDPGLVAPPPMLGPIVATPSAAGSSAPRPPPSAPAALAPDAVIAKPRSAAAASDAAAAREPVASAAAATKAAPPPLAPEGPVDPARARVLERIARKESLDGIDAEGGDLTGLDLSGQSLVRAHLRGAKLAGAKLGRAVLTGAVLTSADLTGADLEEADLEGADLERATIVEAKLDRAKIGGVNLGHARARRASFDGARGDKPKLAGADLEGASLRRVELTGADLRSAKLGSARFEAAQLPDALLGDASGEHVVFDGARLTKAQAPGAMLAGASFKHADLSGSLWERAKLPRACFEGANLRGANLQRAALANADFEGADLSKADLQRMNAERADFRTASLDGADLRKVQAPDACFADVGMHRANAEKANLAGASFAGADLRGSTFRAATLSRVNASFAKLDGADLREADLTYAVLRGATREGAKLNGADMTGVDEGLPGDPEPAAKP